MSFSGKVRNLSPDFVRDVWPTLPGPPPDDAPFSREHVELNMEKTFQYKEKSMNRYWPHLRDAVTTQNLSISMRDGVERTLRVYTPVKASSKSEAREVVYSLHGGGFVAGNIDSEDLINRQICTVCDVVVFSLDHRLAPEYPVVPVGLDDCEDGLKWTCANASKYGADSKRGLIVAGTSSGAAISATLGIRAHKLGLPVSGLVLRQPVFILGDQKELLQATGNTEWLPRLKSVEENWDAPILSGKMGAKIRGFLNIPLDKVTDGNNFPIFASKEELSRMPPTYIVEASCDPCVDEVELFGDRLKEAGVTVKVKCYEGMPHGFHAHHILQAARDEMKGTAAAVSWLLEQARQ